MVDRRTLVTCALFSLGVIAGCSGKPDGQAAADPATQPAASHETAAAGAAGTVETVQGPVLETMDAANYTYVRVKGPTGDVWAATLAFKVAVGDTVIVPLENPMQNFRSAALKRDFPLIYFSSNVTKPGEAPPSMAQAARQPMGQAAAAAPALIEPVAAAPGGMTVANIWANRKTLTGKTVTVRGKVVKFNGGIMGLNWAHVQDGSGSVKDGTHDITITSNIDSRVGDVVTVTGTVVTDKDFGAGYAYAVMLQGAKIIVK